MIVSINQPAYLPWPGYFDRIQKSDLHIVLDHVQFEKNSLTNRNKIKTPQGWSWVTVPVKTKGKFKACPLSELETNESIDWSRKHYNSILANYSKAPFSQNYMPFFEDIFKKEWPLLFPLLEETNGFLQDQLDINTEIIKSSSLSPTETKSDLVLELCQKVEATTYVSGPFGRDYLNIDDFNNAGIKVVYHDYQYPEYPQLFGDFEPYMSVIDLLFNCGSDASVTLQNSADSLKQS